MLVFYHCWYWFYTLLNGFYCLMIQLGLLKAWQTNQSWFNSINKYSQKDKMKIAKYSSYAKYWKWISWCIVLTQILVSIFHAQLIWTWFALRFLSPKREWGQQRVKGKRSCLSALVAFCVHLYRFVVVIVVVMLNANAFSLASWKISAVIRAGNCLEKRGRKKRKKERKRVN